MKNNEFRLGYMPTRRTFFSAEDAGKYNKLTYEAISSILPPGVKVFDLKWLNNEGLLFDDMDVQKVAGYFIENQVDAIFAPHCNFGTENAVAQVAKKVQKPFLLWGPRDEAPLSDGTRLRDTQCGLFATSKVLQRYKVPFTYIINSNVTDNVFKKGFLNFIRAANVVKFTKDTRIGQVSSRPQSFYTLLVNEGELLEKFGIENIPINLSTVVRLVNEAIDKEKDAIDKIAGEMKKIVDFSKIDRKYVEKIAALKYVLLKLKEEHNLQALAFQCWDELQYQLGICSCFVHAVLTDEGFPVSCESDVHGAISSLMLQAVDFFNEPTFFSDFTIRHPENDNSELMWHCGAFPPSLRDNSQNAYIGNHFVLPSHAPGTCNWPLKKGNITLMRFECSGDGHYQVLCGEGKAVEGPYNLGTYVYLEVNDWPLWEEKIIYGPYIHHVSCIYGNYSTAIYEACRYIGNLEFDPVEPSLEQIRKNIRSN